MSADWEILRELKLVNVNLIKLYNIQTNSLDPQLRDLTAQLKKSTDELRDAVNNNQIGE